MSYSNVIDSFFLSDDFGSLYGLSQTCPVDLWNCLEQYGSGMFFRPLFSLNLYIETMVWGVNPIGYHLTSILGHCINAFLVYLIASLLIHHTRLAKNSTDLLPFMSGFIFLILPTHTEAVSWISARSDVLATLFCLSSLICYVLYQKSARLSYLIGSILLFIAGLFSKESVVLYPGIVIAYEIYSDRPKEPSEKTIHRRLHLSIIYVFLVILYWLVRTLSLGSLVGGYGNKAHFNLDLQFIFNNLFFYAARTILPPMGASLVLGAFCVIIGIFAWRIFRLLSRGEIYKKLLNLLAFLLASYVIFLLPAINLAPIGLGDSQNERFNYLPSVFSSILLSFLIWAIAYHHRKVLITLFLCLSLVYTNLLYIANENWSRAGEISKNIMNQIDTLETANRLYIVNLPDNLRGAYIYRSGIEPAIRKFCETDKFQEIVVLSSHNIWNQDDEFVLTKTADEYSLTSMHPGVNFYLITEQGTVLQIPETLTTQQAEISNFTKNRFHFKWKSIKKTDQMVYYSKGILMQYPGWKRKLAHLLL